MEVIYTYIRNSIVKTFFIILFMFLVISSFMQVLSQLKFLGKGGYDFVQLLFYVVLLMPRNLYTLFPMIALVTVTFVMGRLMLRHELVAIGSIGVGIFDLLKIIFKTMFYIVLLGVLIGEGLAPTLSDFAKNQRLSSFYSGTAVSVKGGLWLHEDNWYVNIGSIRDQETLQDVYRYKVNSDGMLTRAEYAKTGTYVDDDWVLHDVSWSNISTNKIDSGFSDAVPWSTMLDRKLLNNSSTSPARQPLWVLIHSVMHSAKLGLQSANDSLVFWQRILQPFVCLLMLAIAVIIFFDFERGERYGINIIKALSLGLGFYFSRESISALFLRYGFSPLFSAALPLTIGIVLCVLLLNAYLQENILKRLIVSLKLRNSNE
ncbi:MAG: LPS export ABC transporter permease LptG [Legionellales bacterium]|jgi:lipopolysaccharide export system permease protein|nr:LPS export ABC transporter permease LptG [Legionellales bacterium]